MSDHELRDLLHRVVPDAPDPDPAGPVALARRWRSRRRTAAVAGVAAVVAGVLVTVPVTGGPGAPDRSAAPASPSPTPPTVAAPYAANTCPPVEQRTPTRDVDLTGVVAIVQCSFPDGAGTSRPVTPEAYVDDIGAFARITSSGLMPVGGTCRTRRSTTPGTLVFRRADGTSTTVDADRCDRVRVAGRPVLVQGLALAFDAALQRQRRRLDYRTVTVTAPTCGEVRSPYEERGTTLVERGRESIVAAVVCAGDDVLLERLDEATTAYLQRQWVTAENTLDEGFCGPDPDRLYRYVLARTDRGDVIRFEESRCSADYLVLEPHRVEVDLDDLTSG